MRDALKNAVQSAILFECQLPHQETGIDKSCLSSQNDICFKHSSPQDVAKVIYNGIVEFAVNEFEIDYDNLEREQRKAILSRIRYNPEADDSAKLKYGFYGEVLLDLILRVFLRTSVVAARGYFYSPIENSEPKGFDAFHLMNRNGNINLFNCGALICLFSTTTITEGVNTSAKNIIITSGKKGRKNLRQFDAKNIAGRAGRFQQHYSGRVIDLNNKFEDIVNSEPELLEHKNYDIQAPKTDVDYQITKDQYLSTSDRQEKELIYLRVAESGIPANVFNRFRVVGPKDKLLLYEAIEGMPWQTLAEIKQVSAKLAQSNAHRLYWGGFQTILDLILPIVQEEKLRQLINLRTGSQQQYSMVTVLLSSYLEGGFMSMVNYYTTRQNPPKTKDAAIRTVADFVYNVFKYHLVKYLGLFDAFYRYRVSILEKVDIESVSGLGLLLQKLEYNALSPKARKVSDFGVPFKLIDCYDSQTEYDKDQFDPYEKRVDEQVSRLFQ